MRFPLVQRGGARWAWRALVWGGLAILAALGLLGAGSLPALAQSGAGLANPKANEPRTAAMAAACKGGPGPTCEAAVVKAIDDARAAEGVGPMHLPSYYGSLTEAQQIFVLADLERVDRGLPGFPGLSSGLDHMAQAGATANNDPNGPSGATWGSNWAGGEASALFADYDWMYDDGPGSPNLDCTKSDPSGCWAHRENILGDYGTEPSMGAGVAKVNGVMSLTELFASTPPGGLDFQPPAVGTAGQLVAPRAATPKQAPAKPQLQVSPRALQMQAKLGIPHRALLTIKSGHPFQAVVSVSGDGGHWAVNSRCGAAKTQTCQLDVRFLGVMPGMASAVITVRLGAHTERLHVSAFVQHTLLLGRPLPASHLFLGPAITPSRLLALYRLISL